MFGWNFFDDGGSSSVEFGDEDADGAHGEGEGRQSYNADESKETHTRSQRSASDRNRMRDVAPSIEHLVPVVTAAILTQVRCYICTAV